MQRILPSFGLKGHNMYTIGLEKYFFRPLMQISGAQRQFSSVLLITLQNSPFCFGPKSRKYGCNNELLGKKRFNQGLCNTA
jgi:hypothetical protein